MTSKRITELDNLPVSPTGTEFIPVVQSGVTFKMTLANLRDWSNTGLNHVPHSLDFSSSSLDTVATQSGNVLTGAGDDDGDAITLANVSYAGTAYPIPAFIQCLYGTLYMGADGSWTYTLGSRARALTTGDVKHEIFTYVISDGKGGISTKTVTVTITGTNSAPIVTSVNGSTPINTVLTGNVLYRQAFDYETDPTVASFTIAGISGTKAVSTDIAISGVGTINIAANGDYTFTPVTDFTGPVPLITYLVTDTVNSVPGYLTLAVNPSIAGTQPVVIATSFPSAPVDDGSGLNTLGAALFIHGVRLGDPSGLGTTTKVYIGGVEVGTYVAMGTDPYAKPGFSRQRIEVRVGALAGLTLGKPYPVKVVVGSQVSNQDWVFTPNPGRIFYVSKTGNNGTAVIGDVNHPWRTLQSSDKTSTADVYNHLRAGDQVIVRGDGGADWTDIGRVNTWLRFLDSEHQGSIPAGTMASGFISFAGMPGETVNYRTTAGMRGGFQGPGQDITGTTGDFVAFSNFHFRVDGGAARDAAPFNMQYNAQQFWIVGNEAGPWVAGDSAVLNAAAATGEGNYGYILCNHFHDIEGTSALQNHGVYPGTNSYGWTIDYNWIHDIPGGSILSFNDSDGGSGTFDTPFGTWTGFTNIKIRHNWFENAAKYILSFNDIGTGLGDLEFEFTNNMCIGSGLPPIHTGTTTQTSDGTIAFNTFYNNNTTVTGGNAMFRNDGWQHSPGHSIRLYDNIFCHGPDTAAGTGWLNDTSGFSSGITWARNLYYNHGDTTVPSPTMDSLAVVGDPKFVNPATGDFSLQSTSPAINAGTQVLPTGIIVNDDYSSLITRQPGGAPDLGCIEYHTAAPFMIGAPSHSGGPQVGVATAFSGVGSWGNSPTGYSRRFTVNNVAVGSADTGTGSFSYTPVAGNANGVLRIEITATNGAGSDLEIVTVGTIAVGAGAPSFTANPTISGTAQVTQTLTCSAGTTSGTVDSESYAWNHYASGVSTPTGDTGNTVVLASDDYTHQMTCTVTLHNSTTGDVQYTTAPTSAVTAAPADPSIRQSKAFNLPANTATTMAFDSDVLNGSLIAFYTVAWDQAAYNFQMSDSQGHLYADFTLATHYATASDNPHCQFVWVRSNNAGAYAATMNPQSEAGQAVVIMVEIQNPDVSAVLDIPQDHADGTVAAVALTASTAATKHNDLILVGVAVRGTGHTFTDDTGWTTVLKKEGTYFTANLFYRKLSAVETFAFTTTLDSDAVSNSSSAVIRGS